MQDELVGLLPVSGAMAFEEWVAAARAAKLRAELWTRLKHAGVVETFIDDATGVLMIRRGANA